MQRKHISKAIILVIAAVIFSMYQETPAQKKPKGRPKAAVEVNPAPPEIAYSVSMSKPHTHLLEVEMRVRWAAMPEKAELKMPVWTPGSYLVREYARHVQDFAVKDAAGNVVAWQKVNKNTWQVETKGIQE